MQIVGQYSVPLIDIKYTQSIDKSVKNKSNKNHLFSV